MKLLLVETRKTGGWGCWLREESNILTRYFESMGLGLQTVWVKLGWVSFKKVLLAYVDVLLQKPFLE